MQLSLYKLEKTTEFNLVVFSNFMILN